MSKTDSEAFSWEEAQEAVREFANGEVRGLQPMTGEMVVLYDDGRYGPNGRKSPPNVELITRVDSIYDTRTDRGIKSFQQVLDEYPVEVLNEVDLSHTDSDAQSKAYVGIPQERIDG